MSHKIAFIGAGSVVFSRNLTGDLLQYPAFADATFTYMDIDADRLDVGAALCRKVADALGVKPTIEKTMNQREAIEGADFVVCMVQIGGFSSTLVDFEIPRRYGLNFTIADTTGPGGIFRALRTYPFMEQLARDILDYAKPDAWLLNYSNPMSANMQSLLRPNDHALNAVGLCHSVQGTYGELMGDLGIPEDQGRFKVAGINHMAFFLELRHKDRDLYDELFARADEFIAAGKNKVRYELMKRLGYFITESSEHNAEYSAHFLPHDGYAAEFDVPIDEYLRRCDGIVDEFARLVAFSKSDEPMPREKIKKSHEYGSVIANSIVTGEPKVVYGNLPNFGAIPNLPDTAIVETPTLVDANGCHPTRVDPLPPQLVNYVTPHLMQHELFITAAMEGRRDAVYQACFADPLTAATLPMDKIVDMCDELITAHGDLLPDLDRTPSRTPGSGKTFMPPTPEELRASWDQAKQHTSDEDVLSRWHLLGPVEDVEAVRDTYAGNGRLDVSGWAAGEVAAGKEQVMVGDTLKLQWKSRPAFAYTEFDSVHARSARIRTAAGENCVIWINGTQVHDEGGRAQIEAELRQGTNSMLILLRNPDHSTKLAAFLEKPNF
ncbi:MAG: alpha-galactosidase [Planctomycetota bacterium]